MATCSWASPTGLVHSAFENHEGREIHWKMSGVFIRQISWLGSDVGYQATGGSQISEKPFRWNNFWEILLRVSWFVTSAWNAIPFSRLSVSFYFFSFSWSKSQIAIDLCVATDVLRFGIFLFFGYYRFSWSLTVWFQLRRYFDVFGSLFWHYQWLFLSSTSVNDSSRIDLVWGSSWEVFREMIITAFPLLISRDIFWFTFFTLRKIHAGVFINFYVFDPSPSDFWTENSMNSTPFVCIDLHKAFLWPFCRSFCCTRRHNHKRNYYWLQKGAICNVKSKRASQDRFDL